MLQLREHTYKNIDYVKIVGWDNEIVGKVIAQEIRLESRRIVVKWPAGLHWNTRYSARESCNFFERLSSRGYGSVFYNSWCGGRDDRS